MPHLSIVALYDIDRTKPEQISGPSATQQTQLKTDSKNSYNYIAINSVGPD